MEIRVGPRDQPRPFQHSGHDLSRHRGLGNSGSLYGVGAGSMSAYLYEPESLGALLFPRHRHRGEHPRHP